MTDTYGVLLPPTAILQQQKSLTMTPLPGLRLLLQTGSVTLNYRIRVTPIKFQNQFASDFEQAVNTLNPSLRSYADKIGTASEAWSAWICGAYGVCLKAFSASIVVNKLTRRLRAWDLLDRGMNSRSQSDNETLLSDITQLSIILLPFSPFERETGTPGTVIDRGLKELQLGFENPFCNEK